MFTGLVEVMAEVQKVTPLAAGVRLQICYREPVRHLAIGESIAVNGCCLTVVQEDTNAFAVDAGSETLARTTLGHLVAGDLVNLERAVSVGDRMGGHFVSGHIDCMARLVDRRDEDDWSHFRFQLPPRWMRHLAAKGSVTVDGVSLTVVDVGADTFSIALIPHTLTHTTLGRRSAGDEVNIETDLLAKYVESILRP